MANKVIKDLGYWAAGERYARLVETDVGERIEVLIDNKWWELEEDESKKHPYFDPKAALTQLVKELNLNLDELTHELKSSEAANINNEGIEAQVDYALGYLGEEKLRLRLKEL